MARQIHDVELVPGYLLYRRLTLRSGPGHDSINPGQTTFGAIHRARFPEAGCCPGIVRPGRIRIVARGDPNIN
jgi:hypothetical protein